MQNCVKLSVKCLSETFILCHAWNFEPWTSNQTSNWGRKKYQKWTCKAWGSLGKAKSSLGCNCRLRSPNYSWKPAERCQPDCQLLICTGFLKVHRKFWKTMFKRNVKSILSGVVRDDLGGGLCLLPLPTLKPVHKTLPSYLCYRGGWVGWGLNILWQSI